MNTGIKNILCFGFIYSVTSGAPASVSLPEDVFPATQYEASIGVKKEEEASGEDIVIVTSWITEYGWSYVFEQRTHNEEWECISDPFEGDNRPVDLLDMVSSADLPACYRLVQRKGESRQSSPLLMSLEKGKDDEEFIPVINVLASAGTIISLQVSENLEIWDDFEVGTFNKAQEIEIQDLPIEIGQSRHYRVVFESVSAEASLPTYNEDNVNSRINAKYVPGRHKTLVDSKLSPGPPLVEELLIHRVIRSLRFRSQPVPIPKGQSYVAIDIGPFQAGDNIVAINNKAEILYSRQREFGHCEAVIQRFGTDKVNISQIGGVYFFRILAFNDNGEILATIKEKDVEKAVGVRYTFEKNGDVSLEALTQSEISAFDLVERIPVFEGDIFVGGLRHRPKNSADESILLVPVE